MRRFLKKSKSKNQRSYFINNSFFKKDAKNVSKLEIFQKAPALNIIRSREWTASFSPAFYKGTCLNYIQNA